MDEEGFCYPFINQKECVDCGLCQKVCPMRNADSLKHAIGEVYAAQSLDGRVLKESTSGGVFSLISNFVLEKGGAVVGAAYQDNLQVRHIIIDTPDDLYKIRGAKYVHSDVADVYQQVQNFLRQGRWVYFTGTPCQVAGLKSFLRKEYATLVTSDLFCHGTPSQKVFDAFIRQIEKDYNRSVNEVIFRDKSIAGWGAFSSFVIISKKGRKRKITYDRNLRAFYKAFVKGLITRNDCFSCPFACPERTGDITIADYWDIEYIHPKSFNTYNGVSLVTVNSAMGREIWDKIKTKTNFIHSSAELVLKTTNMQFQHPTIRPGERDKSVSLALSSIPDFVINKLPANDKKSFYKEVIKNRLWNYSLFRKLVHLKRKIR
ncbi:MAG: Coenzyme F420 hydrogenase/dehydrogenase, beta subunit C-terminal domain [Bacteroidaceae bacterium]|nr:Coenzyme F420 hydrogenase/dehydrogenase, beta subunit C-terminal domain [Bacteroidaceae bacterium]